MTTIPAAKQIARAVHAIHQRHTTSMVRTLSDTPQILPLSTGLPSLDLALTIGGFPRGRLVEIFGAEATGKTTLGLHFLANAQRLGQKTAFIDIEHSLDPKYARALKVNDDSLLVVRPWNGVEALTSLIDLMESGSANAIVVDSVAALMSESEENDPLRTECDAAVLLARSLRRIARAACRSDSCVLFLNQIREKLGVMFGSPETTAGGRAIRHYTSVRMELRRLGTFKRDGECVGSTVMANIVKSKVGPPWKQTELKLFYGTGVCRTTDLVRLAFHNGLLHNQGSILSYGKWDAGHSLEEAISFFKCHRDALSALEIEMKHSELKLLPPSAR